MLVVGGGLEAFVHRDDVGPVGGRIQVIVETGIDDFGLDSDGAGVGNCVELLDVSEPWILWNGKFVRGEETKE